MNDGEIAEDSDDHIVLADVLDRGAATDLRKKGLAVDEGAIGVSVEKSAARLASNQATSASSTERISCDLGPAESRGAVRRRPRPRPN